MQALMRRLRWGKWKHFRGWDLEGNAFFETPNPQPTSVHLTKRFVEYKIKRHLSEYRFDSIAPQWTAWLRYTRPHPPTLEELMADLQRQKTLQANVAQLEQEYEEERARMRLRQPQQAALPEAQAAEGRPAQEENEAEWIKRDREEAEFRRKKRLMTQSPGESFKPPGQEQAPDLQSWTPKAARRTSA